MTQAYEQTTPDTLKTEFLSPADCRFFQTENGFLGAVINNETYRRVQLRRALPFQNPDDYICITDVDKNELGIIEHLSAFSEDQQALANEELRLCYYAPEITDILTVKEKMGHFYFDVKIGADKKSFTVKDPSKNIRTLDKTIFITDIDGNRFFITDISAISSKSRRKLDPYLY